MKERVVTHHGSSTHSDGHQKSYISTVVVTNPERGAVKNKMPNEYGGMSDS